MESEAQPSSSKGTVTSKKKKEEGKRRLSSSQLKIRLSDSFCNSVLLRGRSDLYPVLVQKIDVFFFSRTSGNLGTAVPDWSQIKEKSEISLCRGSRWFSSEKSSISISYPIFLDRPSTKVEAHRTPPEHNTRERDGHGRGRTIHYSENCS